MSHTFHIPVLGLGFSIDTPLKVVKFGISSVLSIVDDELIERMRKYHAEQNHLPYIAIEKNDEDSRAKRITAYLNLMNSLVAKQFEELRSLPFDEKSELTKYFELLPDTSDLKQEYLQILQMENQAHQIKLQYSLKQKMKPGFIDVNIMSKVDKINHNKNGDPLGDEFTDALASLRGFANSTLNASVVLSAGMNPRLYSYLENFPDFLPQPDGRFKKRIILKVSDYRSAIIQAKFLAKKGLWVSEFRIESGLNCGGHAFATEGYLLGPVLEEFKQKRAELQSEVSSIYQSALANKEISSKIIPKIRITVQGGIGTSDENNFLLNYYQLDGTGWGSPFLLVPEVTNVDIHTLSDLEKSTTDDFFISEASPLGVPFNNFRKSGAEVQRLERIAKGRPGSPCTKKFLVSNTEFTENPICTASREYQNLKIRQLDTLQLTAEGYSKRFDEITAKTCLCVGLCSSVYIKNDMLKPRENKAVSICPGPNLAYFSGIFSLEQMVKHIYGKINLLKNADRPHMLVNELNLYIDYLKKDIGNYLTEMSDKKEKQLTRFKEQLQQGIQYYKSLLPSISESKEVIDRMKKELRLSEEKLNSLQLQICEA